jgi:hypothetical protein
MKYQKIVVNNILIYSNLTYNKIIVLYNINNGFNAK